MEIQLSRKTITSQFIQIQLSLSCSQAETVHLQLASWRAGRYEIVNYAQKVRGFNVKHNGTKVEFQKVSKDCWEFFASVQGNYQVEYEFYANQMDAGGSWSDDQQLYLNFTNFVFRITGREEEPIHLFLNLPEDYRIGTALPKPGKSGFLAQGYHHLVDSPMIASPALRHFQYSCRESLFHLWFQGEIHFDMDWLISEFYKFTEKQIIAFGEFPLKDYHFLFQLLPYSHYHGVEHRESTVITLGPSDKLGEKDYMDALLGISSHELYHFWNVCRIRPEGLLPCDFSKEAYLDTGLVMEGVTTYMGDHFLLQSGFFSLDQYLNKIEKSLNREFENFGWRNQSIVDSSIDLWLDGYKTGIPEKKVSIYNRGAIISMCLDLMLKDKNSSLQEVMGKMWQEYGNTKLAYTLRDFINTIIFFYRDKEKMDQFVNAFIYGTEDILPVLTAILEKSGIKLRTENRADLLASDFGIIASGDRVIEKLFPESLAFEKLMIGDQIIQEEEGQDGSITLELKRAGRSLIVEIQKGEAQYYKDFKLEIMAPADQVMQYLLGDNFGLAV